MGKDIPSREHGMFKCPEAGMGRAREAGGIRGLEDKGEGKHRQGAQRVGGSHHEGLASHRKDSGFYLRNSETLLED